MNNKRKNEDVLTIGYMCVSLVGLCLLAVLTFYSNTRNVSLKSQKQLILIVFIAICLLGTVAGFSPSSCSKIFHFKARSNAIPNKENSNEEDLMDFMGHHPSCKYFSSHVLRINERFYCAGCTGLAIGAIFSIVGSFLFLLIDFPTGNMSTFTFWVGFLMSITGLFQYNLRVNNNLLHLMLNVVYVKGTFLLLVSVNHLNGNFFLDLYLLTLIIYLIITRISMSGVEHKKICGKCSLTTCRFYFGKINSKV